MKQTFKTALAIVLAMNCLGSWAQWGAPADPNPTVKLKDAYKNYFMIGVALNQRNVSNDDQINLVKAEFNSITAENDMKPGELHPKEGVWNWEKAAKIANFCRQNGIKLRGPGGTWSGEETTKN